MWSHGGWSWVLWFAMSVSMALFWGFAIWLILSMFRRDAGATRLRDHPAERILAERFARGEVDEDEYRRRVEALREPREPTR